MVRWREISPASAFSRLLGLAVLSLALNCRSSSQWWREEDPEARRLDSAAAVMPDKFGTFNYEELEQNLYSVDISMHPIVAGSPEGILEPGGAPAGEEVETSPGGSENSPEGPGGVGTPSESVEGTCSVPEDIFESPRGVDSPPEDAGDIGSEDLEMENTGSLMEEGYLDDRPSVDSPEEEEGEAGRVQGASDQSETEEVKEVARDKMSKVVHVEMMSKQGQKYRCSIPDLPVATETGNDSTHFPNVSKLLAPLENRACLKHNKGWWTFEYCHRKFIRQYHIEAGKVVGKTLYMGHYSNETLWNQTTVDKVTDIVRSVKRNLPYDGQAIVFHSVLYENGTECDITGKPRRTLVKMTCSVSGEDKLVSVEEVDTCNYLVFVQTPLLCSLPLFRQLQHGSRTVISCSPLVSRETYTRYIEAERERTKAELVAWEAALAQVKSRGSSLPARRRSEQPLPHSSSGQPLPPSASDQPLPSSLMGQSSREDMAALNLALLKLAEQLFGTGEEKREEEEGKTRRRFLLEKLVRRVQPALSKAQVEEKAREIMLKGGDKNLDHLLALMEGEEEGEGEGGKTGGGGGETVLGMTRGVASGGGQGSAGGEGEGREKPTAVEGVTTGVSRGQGQGSGVGQRSSEEEEEEDGEDVWDQLAQLDDESLAALEVEVTEELKRKLAEMGMPIEGGVKLKVIKWTDLNLDDDEDLDDMPSEVTQTEESVGHSKENKIRVVEMGFLTESDLEKNDMKSKQDDLASTERRKVSDLEAAYRSLWSENEQKDKTDKKLRRTEEG